MRCMKWTTAIKQAKKGLFEFVYDAKIGNNEVRRPRANGGFTTCNVFIIKDDRTK